MKKDTKKKLISVLAATSVILSFYLGYNMEMEKKEVELEEKSFKVDSVTSVLDVSPLENSQLEWKNNLPETPAKVTIPEFKEAQENQGVIKQPAQVEDPTLETVYSENSEFSNNYDSTIGDAFVFEYEISTDLDELQENHEELHEKGIITGSWLESPTVDKEMPTFPEDEISENIISENADALRRREQRLILGMY